MRKRMRPETLEKYVTRARDTLVDIARKGETITYSELMKEMGGPSRGYIGQVLKEVCRREHQEGRPLLSSVVVRAGDKHPGGGFWKSSPVKKSIGNSSKQRQLNFWEKERSQVYEYWQQPSYNVK